ncbi:MAG: bifunctional diguanylate cyclase/phosphodiesterase [Oscillospiraceae bacterium]|nr:bifunctional diguanylate cyclase/phosphodiesterase [Oscillospiraceae bacterium]
MKRVTQFPNFYEIASSWMGMIGEEGDCIIIQNKEDMDYYSRINNPWYLTLMEAGVVSVVLFPLRQGNEVLGFIWATNFDTNQTRRIKETLELTTFFISSHIARYKAMQRLKHMSYTDALTGLPNRFACTDYIADRIAKNNTFTAVSIDLNHFKSINDTLGLDAGNQVLIEVASRWKAIAAAHRPDYITRINGDEFMLVLCDYPSEEALQNAVAKYADALSEHLTIDGCDLYVTASFGYAEYPTDAGTADALITHANAAMNAIKKAHSSDHILRYTPGLLRNEHMLEIENKIREALENDTIYYNLQPQYDMDHKLRGFEALARMKDQNGSFISPGEFIPVAEKVGLIDQVDITVFRKAAAFFSSLLQKTDLDLTLSLNASVRHLMKNDFLDEIRELLRVSGIPADKLEIEITESIMIESVDKALQCIDELRNMGLKIAIDDFGTGYSSLSYLNRFPADLLKIDKSFIDKMNTGESSRQYVAAIISMGHIMGFDVISEGVEEPEQLETLREIGCDFIQGFIWGRPLMPDAAEALVMEASASDS